MENFNLKQYLSEKKLLKEEVQMIKITRSISDEGNKQINISVLGGGLKEDGEIMLSFEEAKELHQLAEQFLRERTAFSKAVNTKDKNSTQSIIQIQAKGLKCIISRQEGSVYKGYDEPAGSSTGYFVANQSVAYQLVEKLLNNLNEQEGENSQQSIIGPKTKKINKMVDHNEGLYNWYALEDAKTPLPKEYLQTLENSGIKYEDAIIAKDISIMEEDIRNILNLFKIEFFEVKGESAIIFDGTK